MAENSSTEIKEFRNEMAEFKNEVLRFIEIANKKFDGLIHDVRTNGFAVERVETGLEQVKTDLKDLTSEVYTSNRQFSAVGSMAIKDSGRIDRLEERVETLETAAH